VERDKPKKKIGIGWTNFAAVAMETKKGDYIFFCIPFIKLHEKATAAKFVQPIPIFFFCLSRSTRCGYCSYQVSSISIWRVTCYDLFCVFNFF
jgi:hypothetical protein